MRMIAWLLLLSLSANATGPTAPIFSDFTKMSKTEQESVRSLVEACSNEKMTQIITLTAEEKKYASSSNKNLAKVVVNIAPENSSSPVIFDCAGVGVGPFDLSKHPALRPGASEKTKCGIDPSDDFYALTQFSRDQLYRAELARCESVGTALFSSACLKEIGCNVARSFTTGAMSWVIKQFGPRVESEKKSCLGMGQDNCLSSLVQGFVSDLWGMVEGLWSGIKWVGSKIADGAEWVYDYFSNNTVQTVESSVSKKLIAAKAMTESQFHRFARDPIGFIKETVQKMMGWLMKQVEPYQRKGEIGWKCATCDQILNVGCRIAGMAAGEVTVAFFTGGTLNLASKAGKSGKIAEILSSLSKFGRETAFGRSLVYVGKQAGRFAKAVLYLPGKAFQAVSKLPGLKQFVHVSDEAFMRGFLGKEGFIKLGEAKAAEALLHSTQKKLGVTLSPEEKAALLEHPEVKWAKLSKEEIRKNLDTFLDVPNSGATLAKVDPNTNQAGNPTVEMKRKIQTNPSDRTIIQGETTAPMPLAPEKEVVQPKVDKVMGANGVEVEVEPLFSAYTLKLTRSPNLNDKFIAMDRATFSKAVETSPVTKVTAINEGVNPSYIVELDNKAVGIFKPSQNLAQREAQNPGLRMNTGDHRNEVVVQALDESFGLGIVPKTTFKKVTINGKELEGSFMLFEKNARTANTLGKQLPAAEKVKLDLLDYLVENADRHTGNYMVTNKNEVRAIDNGITFWQGENYAQKTIDANKGIPRAIDEPRTTRKWSPSERNDQWGKFFRTQGTLGDDPTALIEFMKTPTGQSFYSNLKSKNYDTLYRELHSKVPQLSDRELKSYVTRVEARRVQLVEAIKQAQMTPEEWKAFIKKASPAKIQEESETLQRVETLPIK